MNKARIFGLALIALVAVSAVGATAASADEFTATVYSATVTGKTHPEFTDEFVTTAGVVKCTTATYTGTIGGSSTTLTVTPAYSGCTFAGFPATVEVNGCDYLFHVSGGTSTEGVVDIICPSGKEITVVAKSGAIVKCTLHVPPQSGLGTVRYTNLGIAGATEEVTVNAEVSVPKYTHTTGFGVGHCLEGSGTNGTLKAKALVAGEEDFSGGHVGVRLSNA